MNGIVILDKTFYEKKILKLISDVKKFKELNEDPALTREGQLQRFPWKVKDKDLLVDNTYKEIYPSCSKSVTIYGLAETHNILSNDFQDLSFRRIVSSIATYGYNLGNFLSELLNPVTPNEHAKDSFFFVKKYKG